jgi:hypothetical protein
MAIKVCTSNTFDDAYMPLKALAVYSGLGVRTLRSYLTHPLHPLSCYRIGGKVLVRRSDFDAWATQFRIVPATVDLGAMVDDVLNKLR